MAIKPVTYYQLASLGPYGSHNYSAPGESRTIGTSGCGPTSAAMVIQTLRPDKKVTPIDTAEWSMKHGYKYKNQGTAYSYFVPQMKEYGLKCKMLNAGNLYHNPSHDIHDKAKKLLQEGNMLICCMGPGIWTKAGHYVVAWKVEGNTVYINDPASKADARAKNKWTTFKNEVKYYWSISYGDKTKASKDGNIYKSMDVKNGKYGSIHSSDTIYHVKDMGNGWSIATNGDRIGYVKNTVIGKTGLSEYKKAKVAIDAPLRASNNRLSDKIEMIPAGTQIQVISKRKNWTNVVVNGKKGYIATKKINF